MNVKNQEHSSITTAADATLQDYLSFQRLANARPLSFGQDLALLAARVLFTLAACALYFLALASYDGGSLPSRLLRGLTRAGGWCGFDALVLSIWVYFFTNKTAKRFCANVKHATVVEHRDYTKEYLKMITLELVSNPLVLYLLMVCVLLATHFTYYDIDLALVIACIATMTAHMLAIIFIRRKLLVRWQHLK